MLARGIAGLLANRRPLIDGQHASQLALLISIE
jgi:hypothetical protein